VRLWGLPDGLVFLMLLVLGVAFRCLLNALLWPADPLATGCGLQDQAFALLIARDSAWVTAHLGVIAPLYPFFLAGVYKIFGDCPSCALYAQTLWAGLTAGLLFLIGKRVYGRWVGLLAALGFIVLPSAAFLGSQLSALNLVLPLVCLTVLALLSQRPDRSTGAMALVGIAYGLLIHTDARFLFYLPFLCWHLLARDGFSRPGWKAFYVFGLVLVLVSLPWTLRNFRTYDRFVLIHPRTLVTLHLQEATGTAAERPPALVAELARDNEKAGATGIVQSRGEETAAAPPSTTTTEARQEPVPPEGGDQQGLIERAVRDAGWNAAEFWRIWRFKDQVSPQPKNWIMRSWSLRHNLASILVYAPMFVLALVGALWTFRRYRLAAWLLVGPPILHTLLYLLMGASARDRLPVEPLLLVLAMTALMGIVSRLGRRAEA
jgi:4-amino-4-deoxy-L-arabinose transferase-like glycosyltransferase